jgi:prophage antirepressor-like protein
VKAHLLRTHQWSAEGRQVGLTPVMFKGSPHFIGAQVGEALGYNPGSALVKQVAREWADEFTEDKHFILLRGEALRDLVSVANAGLGGENPPSWLSNHTPKLMLLTEPGLHKVLLKTSKPAGGALREELSTVILPEIIRTGTYGQKRLPGTLGRPTLPPGQKRKKLCFVRLNAEELRLLEGISQRYKIKQYADLKDWHDRVESRPHPGSARLRGLK